MYLYKWRTKIGNIFMGVGKNAGSQGNWQAASITQHVAQMDEIPYGKGVRLGSCFYSTNFKITNKNGKSR